MDDEFIVNCMCVLYASLVYFLFLNFIFVILFKTKF